MVCTRRAGCEEPVWRALLLLLPALAASPAAASALASLAASPIAATVLVACSGREFGGRFVVKTDALFACAGARLATMLVVKADTLLVCGSEQQ